MLGFAAQQSVIWVKARKEGREEGREGEKKREGRLEKGCEREEKQRERKAILLGTAIYRLAHFISSPPFGDCPISNR